MNESCVSFVSPEVSLQGEDSVEEGICSIASVWKFSFAWRLNFVAAVWAGFTSAGIWLEKGSAKEKAWIYVTGAYFWDGERAINYKELGSRSKWIRIYGLALVSLIAIVSKICSQDPWIDMQVDYIQFQVERPLGHFCSERFFWHWHKRSTCIPIGSLLPPNPNHDEQSLEFLMFHYDIFQNSSTYADI